MMQIIKAVLFEPVGCLAEFPAQEFNEIVTSLFGQEPTTNLTGSEAYWHWLDLLQQSGRTLTAAEASIAQGLELQAVENVDIYEDVIPAVAELRAMDITLVIASSLSSAAVSRFLEKFSLTEFFPAVWTRDNAGGVKTAPLAKAMESTSFPPKHVMALVDTVDSLTVAKEIGANSILMINDYEEGKRLAMHAPTGGIVSLRELPDAIRLVAESAKSLQS